MLVKLLLFVHVMGAIMWLGGGWVFQLFTERAVATDNLERMKGLVEDGERLGKKYFGPLSVVVLASGLLLVWRAHWGYAHAFVIGGLAGLVASAAIGGAFIGPTVARLKAGFESSPTVTPDLKSAMRRLRNVGRADAVITTAVVYLMTVKPGL